ncbi:HAD family hydrolase [Paenibacillus sp. sgz500958]|uniref:HAD family hydrolase n=1 Tax=Paenibacillus sp. sgz500958 TaxID=3242475 RepID=UPI0036D2D597
MAFLHVNGQSYSCKGILFDKDGTLLDFIALWGTWAENVLSGINVALTDIGSRHLMDGTKLLGTVHNAAGQVTGYDPAGPLSMATMEETYGLLAWQLYYAGMPWNEALTTVREISRQAMAEVRERRGALALPGLLDFLQQCAGASVKLGVVTSDESTTTVEHLDWLGLSGVLGSVITRDKVSRGKPSPDMAELACRELGLTPGETVLIGDSNADMQMGKNAGLCLTVGITSSSGSSSHLLDADVVITDYTELMITT